MNAQKDKAREVKDQTAWMLLFPAWRTTERQPPMGKAGSGPDSYFKSRLCVWDILRNPTFMSTSEAWKPSPEA